MAGSRRAGRAELPDPPGALRAALGQSGAAAPAPIVVAFSGGLDSTVLLHAAAALLPPARVVAVHVDHGLQRGSAQWAEHCVREAAALGVVCHVRRLAEPPGRGQSVEAWARRARYLAVDEAASRVGAAVVLTAHHADDQLETFLIRLARGTGLDGIVGIEAVRTLPGGARLLRPFLRLPRAVLEQWARARKLRWVEDPSNTDERLLRNAVRARVTPVLEQVLPALRRHLPATLDELAQARELVRERRLADLHAVAVQSDELGRCLSVSGLRALAPARRAGVLRAWLAMHGARMPSRARLAAMLAQLGSTRADAAPCVRHDALLLCRYRDLVACMPETGGSAGQRRRDHGEARTDGPEGADAHPDDGAGQGDARARRARDGAEQAIVAIRWNGESRIECPALAGALRIEAVEEAGIPGVAARWLRADDLQLRARSGGERLRVRSGGPRRSLKNLFQERGVPPWVRRSLPVLWADGRPVWVPRIGVDADCRADSGERYRLWWLPEAAQSPGAPDRDGRHR